MPRCDGLQIQHSAMLRRVTTDQGCLALYVGADFTEYQRAIEAILEANTAQCPIETGRKIQYSAPLRQVAKDQDCLAPYVGADFTEYQRSRVRLEFRPSAETIQ